MADRIRRADDEEGPSRGRTAREEPTSGASTRGGVESVDVGRERRRTSEESDDVYP